MRGSDDDDDDVDLLCIGPWKSINMNFTTSTCRNTLRGSDKTYIFPLN